MTQHTRWGFILLMIFIAALLTGSYLAWQLRRAAPPALQMPANFLAADKDRDYEDAAWFNDLQMPANFLAADKGYGVTIDLTQYDNRQWAETLTMLADNGLTWLRLPLNWAELEPTPGEFDWARLDWLLEQIAQAPANFRLIAVLQTTPAWARPDGTPPTTPPTEMSDLGHFARALAQRYGRQLDYYQIWHEPNLSANWGNAFVDPDAYANLLREAAVNIRDLDPQAYILTAALAPTLEEGPLNLNEVAYLEQLYQAQADRWFDIVAGQPYGFDSEPTDPAKADALNFRRLELLRQVMLNHADADTPVWATAAGWNALPADWAGQPAPWRSDSPATQARRTAAAVEVARRDWPWLGPLLAVRWDTAGLAPDDPARGFALLENPPLLAAFSAAATTAPVATPGRYPAGHPSGQYSPGWRLALASADIPRREPRTLTIPFEGTRLDLAVNRGPFRGYLWVTIDSRPANALPRDGHGRSYVVLYDPLWQPDTVTLAQHLPPGRHTAVIEAEGGWGQWAIEGWTVANQPDTRPEQIGLAIAGVVAVLSGLALLWSGLSFPTGSAKLLWAWAEILVALLAMLGEVGQVIVVFGLAVIIYLSPGSVGLLLLPLLALTILLRPDLGLAMIAFSLSFFQAPVQFPVGSFSPVELTLALTVTGFIFRRLLAWGRATFASNDTEPSFAIRYSPFTIHNFHSLDWAALALVALAFLATLAAANFGVSMREWRVVVCESVIFYFLVRLGLDFALPGSKPAVNWRWAWRLVDAFVAGAVLHAFIALYLYYFTDQAITAEGVRRALGLTYGSPNNLALFLDRAWPILLAIALLPGTGSRYRRWLYGGGLVVVSWAIYLTFSKGALLLGLPVGVVVMALFYLRANRTSNWQGVLAAASAGVVIVILALIPLSQTARFRSAFDFNQGSTGFFRLKLWQASLAMLQDHWLLGVGLDNFLYQYRTRYILPEAWQEPNLSHPHNLLLDFGVRLGLGGLAILLWLQVAFWRIAWRLYRTRPEPLVLGLLGSMAVFVSHGLVDNSYFLVDLAFAFFLTVGVVQGLAEQTMNQPSERSSTQAPV